MGLLERPIDQILRLFADHAGSGKSPSFDDEGRIRMDDREMQEDVQQLVAERWRAITTETLPVLADLNAFKHEFRQLFGFDVNGVDYQAPVEIHVALE
jgi:enoyl-[acyl-carrier protein] reductase/trans-2-enoyl-CoA reductase (NAD+)